MRPALIVKSNMHRRSIALDFRALLPLLSAAVIFGMLGGPNLVTAATTPQGATVTISDTGFSPAAVTIAPGGTVTWKNQGSNVHTATSVPGINPSFDTGGIGPGQASSVTFTTPGSYYYTSATDCLNNTFNGSGPFSCSVSYVVIVGQPGTASPQPAPQSVAPAPAASPAAAGPVGNATVTITDQGISPAAVNILLNGSVTWVNRGSNVHTATSTAESNASGVPAFDTGGIGPGQQMTVGFTTAGTYLYTSSIDCLQGGKPAFQCGPYTIVVSSNPVQQPTPMGGIPTPTPNPTVAALGNAAITIDEVRGFQPNPLNIKVGQTVTWLNTGQQTHSVVLNQGDPQTVWWLQLPTTVIPLDSGGIAPGQSFSFTFTTAGTFPYHSSTDPIYNHDNTCNCTITQYVYNGVVNVTA
jgi:plastocyanin